MNNSNNSLFDMLFRFALKNTFLPENTSPNDKRVENQLQLAALALLAFVGADAIKTVFRKNFGINGLSLLRVVISFLAFILIALVAFVLSRPGSHINERFGSRDSYMIVGVFYFILAFYILIKGVMHKKKSQNTHAHPNYKGDSALLSGLITESGWSQEQVQNWAEPILTVALGMLLSVINVLWGGPLIFCALSIWGYQITEYLFDQNPVRDQMQKHGYRNQADDFHHTQS